MALAALILIDDDTPEGPRAAFGGLDWGAFRLYQVMRAGATHLVVVATRVPGSLVAAIDGLRRVGVTATLVRDAAAAADLFHPDEPVLLVTGTALVPAHALGEFGAAQPPILFCVADGVANDRFERIDATACWSGTALIDGTMVRRVAGAIGAWDLGSTLLRAAVQAHAERRMLDAPPPDAFANAAVVTDTLFATIPDARDGWGMRWGVAPLARAIAPRVGRHARHLARFTPQATAVASVAAIVAALARLAVPAALLVMIATLIAATGARIAAAYGLRTPTVGRWLGIGAALTLLLLVRPSASAQAATFVGALSTVAFGVLLARLSLAIPAWRADVPGQAALILIGGMFGATGLATAIALAGVHGLVSLAVAQNRLAAP